MNNQKDNLTSLDPDDIDPSVFGFGPDFYMKLQAKNREITNLQEQLDVANKKLKELKAPLSAIADPLEIVNRCKDVGFESMAAHFIENKSTSESIKSVLANAVAIRDICAASGVKHEEVLAEIGSPIGMVRCALRAKPLGEE